MIDDILARFGSPSHFTFTWRDAVDILIVAFVVYFLLRLIRGTRAVQMVFGLIAILVVYWFSVLLKLVALRTVLSALIFYLPFAIIVLFAQELRRALAAFGRTPFFSLFSGYHAEETISDLVLAATSLSNKRIGALIVLERREGLKTYIENGVPVDAV
ncbi:MAG: TIGR00159 family protein, partial [Acidobacteriota bacterium]